MLLLIDMKIVCWRRHVGTSERNDEVFDLTKISLIIFYLLKS